MDYHRYLRSKAWRKTRQRYRESGLPQECAVCGDPRYELHHLTYRRLGRERLSDLQPLCRLHHCGVHRGPDAITVYDVVDGVEVLRGLMPNRWRSKRKVPIPNTLAIAKPKAAKKQPPIRISGTLGVTGKKRKP